MMCTKYGLNPRLFRIQAVIFAARRPREENCIPAPRKRRFRDAN